MPWRRASKAAAFLALACATAPRNEPTSRGVPPTVAAPALEPAPVPSADAEATADANAPSPSPSPSASAGPTPTESPEPEPGTPRELTPEHARGKCTGRATLETKKGNVSCYPYRCRAGRCLLSCASRGDCAGSDGPADLAENGWPLDCANKACYPLPPRHVHP